MFGGKKQKIQKFWNYFKENLDKLVSIKKEDRFILQELHQRLRTVNPGLVFEFGIREKEDEHHQFVISADGIIQYFPDVIEVVRHAPKIPGWKVLAFRQQKDILDFAIQIEDFELKAGNLSFTHFKDLHKESDLVNINVYVSGIQELTDDIKSAIFVFLDSTIGEFNMGMRIGRVGMGTIAEYGAHDIESKILPIEKLGEVLEL